MLGHKGKSGHSTGKFRVSLYKALLFLHVQNGIKSGALNLEHSYKYQPLDDYLIDSDRWQRAKQQLGPTNCCSDSDVRPLRRPFAGEPPEAPSRLLDLVDRYRVTAEAMEGCGRLLASLHLQRYRGDYAL